MMLSKNLIVRNGNAYAIKNINMYHKHTCQDAIYRTNNIYASCYYEDIQGQETMVKNKTEYPQLHTKASFFKYHK